MRRIRTEQKARRLRDDDRPVLPLDPRDSDVLRAKRLIREAFKDRERD